MRCGEYVGRNQTIGGNQTNRPRSCHTWPRSLTALTWTVALSKTRHRDLFLGELPAVGDTRQQRNTALVAVQQINLHSRSICTAGQFAQQVNLLLLGQGLQVLQNFALQGVHIGVGGVL